jgi:hypothetical protein
MRPFRRHRDTERAHVPVGFDRGDGAMGDVVAFVQRPSAVVRDLRSTGPMGEIRLFDGVRIERFPDPDPSSPVRPRPKRPPEPSRRAP